MLSCFYKKKKKNAKGLDRMVLATSFAWTVRSNPGFRGSQNCHICWFFMFKKSDFNPIPGLHSLTSRSGPGLKTVLLRRCTCFGLIHFDNLVFKCGRWGLNYHHVTTNKKKSSSTFFNPLGTRLKFIWLFYWNKNVIALNFHFLQLHYINVYINYKR